MDDNWQEMLARLRVAIKRENDVRDASFLHLTTSICGVEIRQMTPRDLLILDGIGNPLMSNTLPSPAQLADFLWKLSPQFKPNAPVRRFLFGWRIRKLDYLAAVKACWKYLEDTFQDSPASSGLSATPFAGWCAHLLIDVAGPAGLSNEQFFSHPLKCLFQYRKVIRRHNDPECPMHNPSDKIKGDYIRNERMQNERQKLVNLLSRRAKN